MTLSELTLLLDYHYWARDRVLDAAELVAPEPFTRIVSSSFTSLRDTLGHLYGADVIWCARWEGEAPTALVDPGRFEDVASIRAAWLAHEPRVRGVVDRLGEAGIRQPLAYLTTDGRPNAQIFWQQVQHLVNHGSYHRGQVSTLLRQVGAAPPKPLDLIAFYRERGAPAGSPLPPRLR